MSLPAPASAVVEWRAPIEYETSAQIVRAAPTDTRKPFFDVATLQIRRSIYRHTFANNHKLELSAAGGRSARGLDNTRYTRWVSGASALWSSPQNWWGRVENVTLRLSGSHLYDDPGSIDVFTTVPARVRADALGARAEARIKGGFTIDAEYGHSDGQQNIRGGRLQNGGAFSANLAYRRPAGQSDTGWHRLLPASSRASYELVGHDYFSPQASAGADQMRWSWQSEYPFFPWLGYRSSVNRSEDNARERRPTTNATLTQGHNINLTPFLIPAIARRLGIEAEDEMVVEELVEDDTAAAARWIDHLQLQNFRMTFDFRRTERSATNASTNVNVEDYSTGFGHRMGKWSIGGQFAWQLTDNDVTSTQDRRNENWSLNAGRPWEIKRLDMTLQTNAGIRRGYDALRTGATSSRNTNVNAGMSLLWKGLTAQQL